MNYRIPFYRPYLTPPTKAVHSLLLTTLCTMLLCFSAVAEAPNDIRIALVIGNADYAGNPLQNPVNDATAIGRTLKHLGFAVIELHDAGKAQMEEAIARVHGALNNKHGIGMLYYAGHGLQLDWHNYMVPVDAKLLKAADVPAQGVDVGSVISAFKSAGNRVNILVLDACRDNPFSRLASGRGLAQPEEAPPGTFIAYATAPGNVAEDGDVSSGNGLYTQYLLQEIVTPVAKIEDVFKRVRLNVRQKSQGRQVPWESTSLETDFFFDSGLHKTSVATGLEPLTGNEDGKKAPAMEENRAKLFAQELADWTLIKDSKNIDDIFTFLRRYPNGYINQLAQFKLDQLQQTAVAAQPGRNGIVALSSGARRYQVGDTLTYQETDGLSNASRRFTQRVTYADDDKVEINNGAIVMDQLGGILKNSLGEKTPAMVIAPSDLAVGKSWVSAYVQHPPSGPDFNVYFDNKVVALEEIDALGQQIKAYKIERIGKSNGSITNSTIWINPATMHLLREDYIDRNRGQIRRLHTKVLVSYRPGIG